jgi:hypothetical protein
VASGTPVSGRFDGEGYYFTITMPAEDVRVTATFVAPITASGSLVIKTKGLDQLSYAQLYLYSDASYNTMVTYTNLSGIGTGTVDANGFTVYPAISWSVSLAPSATAKPYYAQLYYSTNSGTQSSKALGLLFSAGSANFSAGERTVEIGVVTMTGTLAVTVDENPITFSGGSGDYRLEAYADAAYATSIAGAIIGAGGAWTMPIPDIYSTVYFMAEIWGSGSYKLGSATVRTETTALSGTFTTKTITITVNGALMVGLFDGTATTLDPFMAGAIAQVGNVSQGQGSGAWTATVLSDVASAYILVMDESMNCYITNARVTLTQGTPVNLVIGNMNFIGVYSEGD